MSHSEEVERYVKKPGLLVELCREVIERLLDAWNSNGETAAMETQLKEIARAIDKLDKQGVQVPEGLRAEKTRLAATLGMSADATQTLNNLVGELEELLKSLKDRLGRTPGTASTKKHLAKQSKSPKTDKTILRQLIIEALRHLGGSAHKNDILKYMEEKLHGNLLPGDMEWRETTDNFAWQNNACWERNAMKNDGILKANSPRGIWELREDYR